MTSSSVSLPFPGSNYWLYIKKKKYIMYKLSLFKLAFDIYVFFPLYYLHEASEHWISSHFLFTDLLRWKSRRDCEIFFAFIRPFSFISQGKNKPVSGQELSQKLPANCTVCESLKPYPFWSIKINSYI